MLKRANLFVIMMVSSYLGLAMNHEGTFWGIFRTVFFTSLAFVMSTVITKFANEGIKPKNYWSLYND